MQDNCEKLKLPFEVLIQGSNKNEIVRNLMYTDPNDINRNDVCTADLAINARKQRSTISIYKPSLKQKRDTEKLEQCSGEKDDAHLPSSETENETCSSNDDNNDLNEEHNVSDDDYMVERRHPEERNEPCSSFDVVPSDSENEKTLREVEDFLSQLGINLSSDDCDGEPSNAPPPKKLSKRDVEETVETVADAVAAAPAEPTEIVKDIVVAAPTPDVALVQQPADQSPPPTIFNGIDVPLSRRQQESNFDLTQQALKIQEHLTNAIVENQIKTDQLRDLIERHMSNGKSHLDWKPLPIISVDKFDHLESVGEGASSTAGEAVGLAGEDVAMAAPILSLGILGGKAKMTGLKAKAFLEELVAKAKLGGAEIKFDLADLGLKKLALADLGIKSFAVADLGKKWAIADLGKKLAIVDLAKIGVIDKLDFGKKFVGLGLDKFDIGDLLKGGSKFDFGQKFDLGSLLPKKNGIVCDRK